nr:hypothetical protein [uncultured Methanoregula sp.]
MNSREWIHVGAGIVLAVFLSGCLILGAGVIGIPGHTGGSALASMLSPKEQMPSRSLQFQLNASLPPSPPFVPAYRVSDVKKISFRSNKTQEIKMRIPGAGEAPGIAKEALEPFGGLPPDAVLVESRQVFWTDFNASTGVADKRFPIYTRVQHRMQANRSPVMGTVIEVRLGENGELLELTKEWCTLVYAGETPVITAKESFEKLKRQDLLETIQCCSGRYSITRVELGYHVETYTPDASDRPVSPGVCTPVWIFSGIKQGIDEEPFPFIVNATRG